MIVRQYLSTWFLIDLAGGLPYRLMLRDVQPGAPMAVAYGVTMLLRMLRCLRLPRVIRLRELHKATSGFVSPLVGWIQGTPVRILRIVSFAAWVLHCFNCALYWVDARAGEDGRRRG